MNNFCDQNRNKPCNQGSVKNSSWGLEETLPNVEELAVLQHVILWFYLHILVCEIAHQH